MSINNMGLFWEKAEAADLTQYGIVCTPKVSASMPTCPRKPNSRRGRPSTRSRSRRNSPRRAQGVKWFDHITDLTVKWAGSLYAVLASVAFTLIWLLCGPFFAFSDTWQLWANTITTILTFVMVFIIQHSQNRDGAALQAKLTP